jgi:hypothetical protein
MHISNAHHTRIEHASLRSPRSTSFCFFAAILENLSINFSICADSALQHRTSCLAIALDLRRSVFHHRAFFLSILTVQPDLDAPIMCIDVTEQATADKPTPSCCPLTHLFSSGMAAFSQYGRWPPIVVLPVFSSHKPMAGTTHRRRHTIRLSQTPGSRHGSTIAYACSHSPSPFCAVSVSCLSSPY